MVTTRILWYCGLAGALGMATAGAQGATWYLSANGDDAASGDAGSPWKTLAKANASVRPGDTVILLPGRHEGCIEPSQSGTSSAPIMYRSQEPYQAVLLGGRSSDDIPITIRLKEREHIIVDGFMMTPAPGFGWMRLDSTRHCIIRNCHMEDVRNALPIRCGDSHYNRYENLVCTRANNLGKWGHVSGDLWNNFACSRNVFYRVHISRAAHRPFGLWNDCPENIIRECIFDCRWGRNFEFFSAPRLLMERSIVTNGFDGSGSADGRAKLFVLDSIFRRNVIYRNYYGPLVINAYQWQDMEPFSLLRTRLYHNTWAFNHEYGFQMIDINKEPDPHRVSGNIFLNNIFAFNDPGGDGVALSVGGNVAPDNRFVGNLLHGQKPGDTTVRITWVNGASLTTAAAEQTKIAHFEANLDADPAFVAPHDDDFRLAANSPCIDAGRPLTNTRGAGSGTRIEVADARWFFDGFGIPGEVGDTIWLGDRTQAAVILRADIDADVLVLDRPLSWEDETPVFLPFTGKAPDLGAYERGEAQSGPRIPGGLRVETMETAVEPVVQTDFEPENLEQWHYYWNFSRQHHTDARIDETTAFSGQRSMRIFATEDAAGKDDAIMSCDIRPRWWDIDRFPILRFAYRIPPGVPVGCWLRPFQSSRWSSWGICVGGSPARDSGGSPDLDRVRLIDDGQWHQVSIDARWVRELHPDIRLLQMFRFGTNRNGKHGDQYWFDDVQILPAADAAAAVPGAHR